MVEIAEHNQVPASVLTSKNEAAAHQLFEPLDASMDATELDVDGQSCTTTPQYVSGLSDNECSESMVDRRSENS